jgi:hypothetical protein
MQLMCLSYICTYHFITNLATYYATVGSHVTLSRILYTNTRIPTVRVRNLTPLNQNQSYVSFCANVTSGSLTIHDPWFGLHSHSKLCDNHTSSDIHDIVHFTNLCHKINHGLISSGVHIPSPLTHDHGYSLDISIAW